MKKRGDPDVTIPAEVIEYYLVSVAALLGMSAPELGETRLWRQAARETHYLARMVGDARRRRPKRIGSQRTRKKERTV